MSGTNGFLLKILFTLSTKQTTLMRRSIVLSLPLQLLFQVITLDMAGRGGTVAEQSTHDPKFGVSNPAVVGTGRERKYRKKF
jgi:hypothetical protein